MLTISEVAAALKLTDATIRNWIERGHIKAVRLPSGIYRIEQVELDRILQQDDGTHEQSAATHDPQRNRSDRGLAREAEGSEGDTRPEHGTEDSSDT